jgi:DNA polymerase-3 subunit chi
MTRVDFYINPSPAAAARQQLACRIAEKAYLQQQPIYLHVADEAQAEQLDTLLWVFRAGSFIPHCRSSDPLAPVSQILIGNNEPPAMANGVLINLCDEVPAFFSRFSRVVEIVSGDEPTRQQARQRYKFYRERGYPLETHELAD